MENNPIEIRRVESSDLPDLLGLYRHLHTNATGLTESPEVREAWDSILAHPGYSIFVAVIARQIVSSCTLIVIPNLTQCARSYGLIENVVTHQDYRRKGIGTALLQYALRHAWDRGCYRVTLLTGRKDESNLHFYESAGFLRGVKTGFIAYPPVASNTDGESP